MKIKDIYAKAVRRGIELDPRGKVQVEAELKRVKKDFDELKEDKKKDFDKERLINPYADTRILYGEPDRDIKTVLAGIDMEVGEVLLADRLRNSGRPIDLIISHHPEGMAMAALYEVMDMQSGILLKYGVPINVAEDIMSDRIKEVERRLLPANHTRAVDAAKLLDMPFMCIHTPADNAVANYLQKVFDEKKPDYISDIIDILKDIPEYKDAVNEKAGPKVVVGSEKRKTGNIFVDMTGGTGGSKDIYEKLSIAGIGTIVGMHIGEDHKKEAEKHHVNVVIAGHMSSDNLGVNLLFDDIFEKSVEIVAASGFRRFSRN
ncbi:MAG TPA: NGG1p interacting factor NIF3 [Thermodesulfobacteriota bacterium]|nr:NGG1p interacting factor NIF3 [Thermodesulfobacteriota bacterium]